MPSGLARSVVKQAPMSDGLECMEFLTRSVQMKNLNPFSAKQQQQQQRQQQEEKGSEQNASSARSRRAQEASKNGSLKLSSQVTDSVAGLALSKPHRYLTSVADTMYFFANPVTLSSVEHMYCHR